MGGIDRRASESGTFVFECGIFKSRNVSDSCGLFSFVQLQLGNLIPNQVD